MNIFEFKRRQFPVRLAFLMTINKLQDQPLEVCGINLEFPCFMHVQTICGKLAPWKPSPLLVFPPQQSVPVFFNRSFTCRYLYFMYIKDNKFSGIVTKFDLILI